MRDKTRYVLIYPNGKFLGIDTNSGYPYPKEDAPHIWCNEKEAVDYGNMFPKEKLKLWEMKYSLKEQGRSAEEIEVYVDSVDFRHEIGEGNAPGPHYIYNSLKEIKEKQPCVEQCGVIRAKLVKLETVQESDYTDSSNDHVLSLSGKYMLMKIALNKIAAFTHKEECSYKEAPVYECSCYDQSQWELAVEALEKVKDD